MKIKSKKSSRKQFITVAIVAIILSALAYSSFAYAKNLWPFNSEDEVASLATEKTADNNTADKDNAFQDDTSEPEDQAIEPNAISSDQPKTPESSTPPEDSSLSPDAGPSVSITSIQDTGSQTRISTLIEAITNSGSCTLKFTKSNIVITQTAGTQASASASTCKGFTIDNAKLSPGMWEASITVTVDGKTSTATKKYEVT